MSARPPMGSVVSTTNPAFPEGKWQTHARCRDVSTDTFYPPDRARGRARVLNDRPAKQICESCAVLVPCRRYALDTREPHGIWGGTTPQERDELLRGGTLPA